MCSAVMVSVVSWMSGLECSIWVVGRVIAISGRAGEAEGADRGGQQETGEDDGVLTAFRCPDGASRRANAEELRVAVVGLVLTDAAGLALLIGRLSSSAAEPPGRRAAGPTATGQT